MDGKKLLINNIKDDDVESPCQEIYRESSRQRGSTPPNIDLLSLAQDHPGWIAKILQQRQ
jgi:hypothetical protein